MSTVNLRSRWDYSGSVAPPLTRTASKERTRRQLLDAAKPLFLEHGFNACSMEAVCAAAGFTTGALYSNFGGKTELAMHVLDELYLEELEKVSHALTESADQSLAMWAVLLEAWVQQTIGEPRWARFELELTTAMAASDELLQAVARRYETLRSQIGFLAQTRTDAGNANWEELGTLALGLILGVAFQRVADPELSVTSVPHALKTLLNYPPG